MRMHNISGTLEYTGQPTFESPMPCRNMSSRGTAPLGRYEMEALSPLAYVILPRALNYQGDVEFVCLLEHIHDFQAELIFTY